MVAATIVIAVGTVVSAAAIVMQWREMVSGGHQTEQIIKAANINAKAAKDFAASAGNINQGISDAVKNLNDQAHATQQAANAASSAARTASENLTEAKKSESDTQTLAKAAETQASSTKLLADSASEQATTAKSQLSDFEAVQAAELVIADFSIENVNGTWKEHFEVLNLGQSVASEIIMERGEGGGRNPAWNPRGRKYQEVHPNVKTIMSNLRWNASPSPTGFDLGSGKSKPFDADLGPNYVTPELVSGQLYKYFDVVVRYRDIFGHDKTAGGCIYFEPMSQQFENCIFMR